MHTQTPLQNLYRRMKQTPFAVLLIVFGAIVFSFVLLLMAIVPKSVAFSYAEETCISELTL